MSFQDRLTSSAATDAVSSLRWSPLVIGVLAGLIAMDLAVRRPLMRELNQVRTHVGTLQGDMQQLVGVRNQVLETNNLLTNIKAQHHKLEEARASLAVMQQITHELTEKAADATPAFDALDRLVSVKDAVLRNSETTEAAQTGVQQLLALQAQVATAGEHAQVAQAAINSLVRVRDAARIELSDIDAAMQAVRQLGDLKRNAIEQGEDVAVAREQLKELAELKSDLSAEAGNIEVAQAVASSLVTLKNGLATEDAIKHADDLLKLRDTLVVNGQSDKATENLEQLISLQSRLIGQTKDVASAMQTLEVLADLGEELRTQVDSLDKMRKSLLEIVLLESTVNRVAKVIEPLTQIGNLRRLSDDEVREAARAVLDSRNTRIARQPEPSRDRKAKALNLDDIPLFSDEPRDVTRDILVPAPRRDEFND